FGPASTGGAPAPMVSETRCMIVTSRAANDTSSNWSGRSLTGGRIASARAQLAGAAHAPGCRVHQDDERDQHEAEPHGERQIALRGLERDRGRHGAGEAVDIAADDHDGADLGGGAAEAGQ